METDLKWAYIVVRVIWVRERKGFLIVMAMKHWNKYKRSVIISWIFYWFLWKYKKGLSLLSVLRVIPPGTKLDWVIFRMLFILNASQFPNLTVFIGRFLTFLWKPLNNLCLIKALLLYALHFCSFWLNCSLTWSLFSFFFLNLFRPFVFIIAVLLLKLILWKPVKMSTNRMSPWVHKAQGACLGRKVSHSGKDIVKDWQTL